MHSSTIGKVGAGAACCWMLLVSALAIAQQTVEVTNAWARATVPAQKAGGVFMDLRSPVSARLISVSSPIAGTVQIHNMKMENGIMKMFAVDGIDLPPGQTVKLAPGGYHVMLLGLKRQIKEGDTIPLSLVVEGPDGKRETLQVNARARAVNAPAHGMDGH